MGSQLDTKYALSTFVKLTTHNSTVPEARPSRNNSASGKPSRTRSVRPPSARNAGDSGSDIAIGTSSSNGTTPPTTKIERQPYCGISHAERKPPIMAPIVNPLVTIIIVLIRCDAGLYSPTSAVAFGRIAPSPSPARKRMTSSSETVVTREVSSVIRKTQGSRRAPQAGGRFDPPAC